MDVSRELNAILLAAWNEAETRGHEYLTPEHVLYASLAFDRGKGIILGCGGNLRRLGRELERFLKDGPWADDPVSRAVVTPASSAWRRLAAARRAIDTSE